MDERGRLRTEGGVDRLLRNVRRDIVDMAQRTAHVAVALSCVEIIAALYAEVLTVSGDDSRDDMFVLSKGHGCMALYAVLARLGLMDPRLLSSYGQDGSVLGVHPLAGKVPGIRFAAGSLGHGLAFAAGAAKAARLQKSHSRVFVLLGDGECDEGSVWEAVALAVAERLDNLVAIVDWNGLQACGRCADISPGVHLPRCWSAFGWTVDEIDGHDYPALAATFARTNPPDTPRVVFCRTRKGKGIRFMEDNVEWHYRPVVGREREEAFEELDRA